MEYTQATQQTSQRAAHDAHRTTGSPTPLTPQPRKLERRDAKLGGVAGGLGAYFDIDPTLIRVLLIVTTFLSGPVVPLMYVAAWIIMPEAGYVHPAPPTPAPPPAPAPPTTTAPSTWAPTPAAAPTQAPVVDADGDGTDVEATTAQQN